MLKDTRSTKKKNENKDEKKEKVFYAAKNKIDPSKFDVDMTKNKNNHAEQNAAAPSEAKNLKKPATALNQLSNTHSTTLTQLDLSDKNPATDATKYEWQLIPGNVL